jgi:hypothetical protein
MKLLDTVKKDVHEFYWTKDYNCATTTLKVLSRFFSIQLSEQVIDSAIGMHGAGKYGAQCGLVEGTLLFIGIYGRYLKLHDKELVKLCYRFAHEFETEFSSLLCKDLRPGGFNNNDKEHLCENITIKANQFSINFINNNMK